MRGIGITAPVLFVSLALAGCGKSEKEISSEREWQMASEKAKFEELDRQREAREAENEHKRRQAEEASIAKLKEKVISTFSNPDGVDFRNVRLSSSAGYLCGQVNFKNGFGIYTTKEFVATDSAVLLDSDDYKEHLSFGRSAEVQECLKVPRIEVVTSSSDSEYKSLNANIGVGDELYLKSDKARIGKILSIESNHEFEDGTTRDAVLLDNGLWVPRETAKMIYVKKE